MILVIGACASGKRTFVESLGFSRQEMAIGELDERPVVLEAQGLVERLVSQQLTGGHDAIASEVVGESAPSWEESLLDQLSSKECVTCCEVGSGLVPMEPSARMSREVTGRLCVRLAARATSVVRMVCGIPVVLKGDPWK